MRPLAILGSVLATAALLILSGCQSEEEKKAEQKKLKDEIMAAVRSEIQNQTYEQQQRLPMEVRSQIDQYVAEKQRERQAQIERDEAERAAKAAAAKATAPKPAATTKKTR